MSRNAKFVLKRYKHVPQGGNWEDIPASLMRNYRKNYECHTKIYHRLDPDKPSTVNPKDVVRSVVAMNKRPHPLLQENARYLLGKLRNSKVVELDKDNPVFGADNLYSVLADFFQGPPKRAFVDITTFTHEASIIVVQIIRLLARGDD